MRALISRLKRICRDKNIIDIILFGSFVKEKEKPGDVDIAVIFRAEDYKKVDEVAEKINAIFRGLDIKPHIEPLVADSIFSEPLFLTLIHEGFSVKRGRPISDTLGVESFVLVSYSLVKLNRSKKTLFGYALRGHGKRGGLLKLLKGEMVGRNSFIVPTDKFESVKEFIERWGIETKHSRILRLKSYLR